MASGAGKASRQPFAIAQAAMQQIGAELVISDPAAPDQEEPTQKTSQRAARKTCTAAIPDSASTNETRSIHCLKYSADLMAVAMDADM